MTDLVQKIADAVEAAWNDWANNAADERAFPEVQREAIRQALAKSGEAVAWGSDEHVMLLAIALASEEYDDPHEVCYEGFPPEPWGALWQKYEGEAKSMIERVTAIAHPAPSADRVAELEAQAADWERLYNNMAARCSEAEDLLAESREREGRMRESLAYIVDRHEQDRDGGFLDANEYSRAVAALAADKEKNDE